MTDAEVDRYLAQHGVKVIDDTLMPTQYQSRLKREIRLSSLPEMASDRIAVSELLWREVRTLLPDPSALMLKLWGWSPTEIGRLLGMSRPTAVRRIAAERRRLMRAIPVTPTFWWWWIYVCVIRGSCHIWRGEASDG